MQKSEEAYAGFLTRLLAFLVDILIASVLIEGVLYQFPPESVRFWAGIMLVLYFALAIHFWEATPGAKLFGIRIVSDSGNRLSLMQALLRTVVSLLPFMLYLYWRGVQHQASVAPSPVVQMLPQLLYILPPFVMLFNRKCQMLHDMAARSVVLDVVRTNETNTETGRGIGWFRRAIRLAGALVVIVVGGYVLLYTSVFFMLGKRQHDAYNASFHTHFATNDYNDTTIRFYQKELERYSREFVDAEGMYAIFAADVKRDLALGCIEAALHEHNETEWLEMGSAFRKDARNKAADTEAKIKKAKANEAWMGHHFYDYDLNSVDDIEEQVANPWEPQKNADTCRAKMSAERMYLRFMARYIPDRQRELERDEGEARTAQTSGLLNKAFYEKEAAKTRHWLALIKQKFPEAFREAEEVQRAERKREAAQKEKRRHRIAASKSEALWRYAERRSLLPPGYFKDVNANIFNDRGETPLIVAAKRRNESFIESLEDAIVDVHLKDRKGKTAYDYIRAKIGDANGDLAARRTYGALRVLETRQLVRGRARIVSYSYGNVSDRLEIAIKGEKCSAFDFPKRVTCKSLKPPSKHSIFEAIKHKENRRFDRLLKGLDDLSIKNKAGYTPLWASIHYDNMYALERLLDAGADIYEFDQFGLKMPLYWAAMTNNVKLLKILLAHGADVNSTNRFGDVALSTAMYKCNNFEAIKILLAHGADPYQKDKRGRTVFEKKPVFCKKSEDIKKMKRLLREGAKAVHQE